MNQNDQMREALRMYMSAGSGNSTDFDLQARAWSMAHQALNHTPDTSDVNETPKNKHESDDALTEASNVNHVGDSNKMVRLTEDELTEIYMRFVGHQGLYPRLFEDVAGCVMAAMIAKNGGSHAID